MNENSGTLTVKGDMFPNHARDAALSGNPLILVDGGPWVMAVSWLSLTDADPMLAKIIAAHLAGKWVVIMDPDAEVRPDSVAVLTDRQQKILQRHMNVLRKLPFKWGEQRRIRQELGITHKQMQFSLQYLKRAGYARDVHKGCWEPTFLEAEDAET